MKKIETIIKPFLDRPGKFLCYNRHTVPGFLAENNTLVAFGFARIRFWGRDTIFIILLATMMLPTQVTMIPIYLFWSKLGLVNTFWPLIFASGFRTYTYRSTT